MHVNVFDFSELLARSPRRYSEFLRVSSLSVGIYVLQQGERDPQKPHTEDEVYYIASGRAKIAWKQTERSRPSMFVRAQLSSFLLACGMRSTTSPNGSQYSSSSVRLNHHFKGQRRIADRLSPSVWRASKSASSLFANSDEETCPAQAVLDERSLWCVRQATGLLSRTSLMGASPRHGLCRGHGPTYMTFGWS